MGDKVKFQDLMVTAAANIEERRNLTRIFGPFLWRYYFEKFCAWLLLRFERKELQQSELCRKGLHAWQYFEMADTFKAAFPEQAGKGRECPCCRRLEYLSDDRTHWNQGLRGVLVQGARYETAGHGDESI